MNNIGRKVISFSLWGDNPNYNIGAIKNAELAKEFYPDFECWFYIHKDSVPEETINNLSLLSNTKIIFKTGDLKYIKPMMWRFEAIDEDDVEINMSRDTDTRILLREKLAVDEWLSSDKAFHIMRDHPHHDRCIQGGMFGTRKLVELPKWAHIMDTFKQNGNRDYDQNFLKEFIYPIIQNNSVIHASFIKIEQHAKDFPIKYCENLKFVGEYVYYDDSRSEVHINILRSSL